MKHCITFAVLMVVVFPLLAFGQTDTVFVPGYYESGLTEGTLNSAVSDAITAGTLSQKVFKLKLFERYVLTASITIPAGSSLTVVADDPGSEPTTAPPQIVWSSSGSITTSYIFDCFGDLKLKNVWVLFCNTSGNQAGTSIKIEENTQPTGQHGTFDGCLFDYSQIGADGSGAISITSSHFKGAFTNCYFRNMSDPHYRYYGRPVSFPFNTTGWHTDSLTFVNCTFANFGYALMQEGSEWSDYVSYNHCTFINGVMFCLESTWWHYLSITNSAFVNMYMYGDLGNNNGNPNGGTFAIDSVSNFGFSPPFTDAERHILFTNSCYYIEPWLKDWYLNNEYSDTVKINNPINLPKPMPMLGPRTLMFLDTTINGTKVWPYMNRKDVYDNTNPAFLLPPTDQPAIKRFLFYKWTSNADTNWAFDPGASLDQAWPLPENLKVTNSAMKTAAMGGFPVGDLYHWAPALYSTWKAQEAAENSQIQNWLIHGVTGVEEKPSVPVTFDLSQNYPNPFNPTTNIHYSISQSGPVSLKVYDLLGRHVATLFDGQQKVGRFTVEFDGSRLASGIYFYKLQAGSNTITKKLVLMK
jgi:hypothetical protein